MQVWSKIQLVLQQMLEQYLMADQSKLSKQRSRNMLASDSDIPVTEEKIDIGAHFNRRRPMQKKVTSYYIPSLSL